MNTNTKPLRTAPGNLVRKAAFMPVENRKVPFARSKNQTVYFNLGGTIEPHESVEEALLRECFEEARIRIDAASVRFLHQFKDEQCFGFVPGTKFEMNLFSGTYRGIMVPSNEIAHIDWFTTADKHRTTPMGGRILDWFAEQNLID